MMVHKLVNMYKILTASHCAIRNFYGRRGRQTDGSPTLEVRHLCKLPLNSNIAFNLDNFQPT